MRKKPKTSSKSKKTTKKKHKLPNNVNEEEFLEVLHRIVKKLGYKFIFGYHSYDDMFQQAAVFAMEGLKNYDNTKPLENFLWTHLRNRLFNFKRDNFKRPDKPCLTCPLYDKYFKCSNNQCQEYSNVLDCSLYKKWYDRNSVKQNIMKPSSIESEKLVECNKHIDGQVISANNEVLTAIEDQIKGEYREIYLRLKHGIKVSKSEIVKLKEHLISLNINYE